MNWPPCANCPDKGCGSRHDTCEKYQAWDRERKEMLKKRKKEMESNTFKIERIQKFKSSKWNEKTSRK